MKIAGIVVTFNRKDYLKRCLDGIIAQSRRPDRLFVVDNASTDGTDLIISGFVEKNPDFLTYVRLPVNIGGSGGFYAGFASAFEEGQFDAYWVMDDDGLPEEHCLEKMLPYLSEYDFVSPVVLSDEDGSSLSFRTDGADLDSLKAISENGIVHGHANPFNGILYSHKLVKAVGFPKKEMFIWGDEINYTRRALKKGFSPVMVLDAIHYHPKDKIELIEVKTGLFYKVSYVDWKFYCLLRNQTYNLVRYPVSGTSYLHSFFAALLMAVRYDAYFRRNDKRKTKLILDALVCGIFGYFGGLTKYLQK